MKRFKVMGLCVAAVFALNAVSASVAAATPPEYKICTNFNTTHRPLHREDM